MKISILCSDPTHPINRWLEKWIAENKAQHQIDLLRSKKEISDGDLLFLISCAEIVNASDRAAYKYTLIIHASDLPHGRGWSPHIWQLLEGKEEITVSLLEAQDKVDSGDIWKQINLTITKDALFNEIHQALFDVEIELMDFAVKQFSRVKPLPQSTTVEATYFPRRKPQDSEIDPQKSIAEQFDKIRVSDPERYPAYFYLHGKKYRIVLEKMDDV